MKELLTILIAILLINFSLTTIEHCTTEDNGECTACDTGYTLTGGQCVENGPNDHCKTKDNNGVCTACDTGYTLTEGECVVDKGDSGNGSGNGSGSSSGNGSGSGSDDSSFKLHISLILGLFCILF